MKRNVSLNDLLIEELTDLLNAESQLVEALPKMAQACRSVVLKAALEGHLKVTREHLCQLQDAFSIIGQNTQGVTCKAMKDIIEKQEDLTNGTEKSHVRDAAIINVAQRMEQYKIVGYQTTCDHASDLGHTRIVGLLYKILNEERTMNSHLNELAQGMINAQATKQSGSSYISGEKFKRGGIKKKSKNVDVSRFISEGNPNIQEGQEN